MDSLWGFIMEMVNELLHPKPYLVCTCGKFEPGERDIIRQRVKCCNCGGWKLFEEQEKEEKGGK